MHWDKGVGAHIGVQQKSMSTLYMALTVTSTPIHLGGVGGRTVGDRESRTPENHGPQNQLSGVIRVHRD